MKLTSQVEILKLGGIMHLNQANGLRRLNLVSDGGPQFDYYKQILIEKAANQFEFYDTLQIFVGSPVPLKINFQLFGIPDSPPLVGQPFSINKRTWRTTIVKSIIDDKIIITKNSVYAIHDISEVRNQKIQQLGL